MASTGSQARSEQDGAVTWDDFVPIYRDEVARYFREQGTDPASPAALATIQTNAESVPSRAGLLIELTKTHTPLTSLRGLRVLDAGCGFGACTIYLALEERPTAIVGLDLNEIFLEVGRSALKRKPVSNVEFVQGDMADLDQPARYYDVVVVNNSFIYFPRKEQMRSAIAELHRVLRPGGVAVFYQPNKWFPREAFTKLIGIQFLPRRLADWLARKSKRRSGYADIRLLSPVEHRRLLSQAGFTDVKVIAPARASTSTGWNRFFVSYYAIAAVKPATTGS